MKKTMGYLLVVMMLWFTLHSTAILWDGLKDELQVVDAAVVLGNKVELNGQPSRRLQARLDRAIDLYKQGYFQYIIVSGGIGKEGFDEAEVMRQYLVKKEIPEETILVDPVGNNTWMTAQNSKELMEARNLKSVMIISQFYHITRSKLAFRKVGLRDIYTAHAKFFEIKDVYAVIREFFAYYKYLFFY